MRLPKIENKNELYITAPPIQAQETILTERKNKKQRSKYELEFDKISISTTAQKNQDKILNIEMLNLDSSIRLPSVD